MKFRQTLIPLRIQDSILIVVLIGFFGFVWVLTQPSAVSGLVIGVHVFFLIVTFLIYFRLRNNAVPSALLVVVISAYSFLPTVPIVSRVTEYVGLGFWTFIALAIWAYYAGDRIEPECVTGQTENNELSIVSINPSINQRSE